MITKKESIRFLDSPCENTRKALGLPIMKISQIETVLYNTYDDASHKQRNAAVKKLTKRLIKTIEIYGFEQIKINILLNEDK